jgi:hypothetical protein
MPALPAVTLASTLSLVNCDPPQLIAAATITELTHPKRTAPFHMIARR